MKYVIIGNSAAAVGCVEGIRQQDREGEIVVIASEPHHTYSRPLISYLLAGKTDETRMKYRPESFYEDNGVEALLGRTALSIQPDQKQVLLDSGEAVSYDKLLVAAGSAPAMPPLQGLDTVEHKTAFMTLDDARKLEKSVAKDTRVLILGAGLIGLKCAEGLAGRTGHITVVDLADHILPSILDPDAAVLMEKHIAGHGIKLVLGDSVRKFEGNGAHLESGKTLVFDQLVLAVGVRPNTSLVAVAGGQVNRGIVVDRFGATTIPDVYAAGDCTESFDVSKGENRILALLPNAYMQGESAGVSMAGGEQPYEKAIPMNAIGFFGLHIITAGTYEGETYTVTGTDSYKKLFYQDGLLKGYILLGEVARAGIYTALIRDRVPLDTVDFSLIREKPQLMAFSRRERSKKLGGVAL